MNKKKDGPHFAIMENENTKEERVKPFQTTQCRIIPKIAIVAVIALLTLAMVQHPRFLPLPILSILMAS